MTLYHAYCAVQMELYQNDILTFKLFDRRPVYPFVYQNNNFTPGTKGQYILLFVQINIVQLLEFVYCFNEIACYTHTIFGHDTANIYGMNLMHKIC